ncbi:hypothetical protein SRHO_G00127990 [Serrasalmus rhombeus]
MSSAELKFLQFPIKEHLVTVRQAGEGASAWDAPVLGIRWQGQAGDLEPPCACSLQSLLSSAALGSVQKDGPRCCCQSQG